MIQRHSSLSHLGRTLYGDTCYVLISDCDYFVDAMSSFGAIPLDLEDARVDYLVSSVNKCLEGVPGFSYIIARLSKFNNCKGKVYPVSFAP